jgi:DNA end-binding protein Ku
VLWTLHYGDEVRPPETYFADIKTEKVEPDLLSLVTALIGKRTQDWTADMVHDPVQENLQAIIEAKKKGRAAPKKKPKEPAPASNVINIMDALRKSMAAEKPKRH